jgi:hypothetical protein
VARTGKWWLRSRRGRQTEADDGSTTREPLGVRGDVLHPSERRCSGVEFSRRETRQELRQFHLGLALATESLDDFRYERIHVLNLDARTYGFGAG